MKKHLALFLGIFVLALHAALADDATATTAAPHYENSSLPRFDLNFPGGTTMELVNAITNATGKPLNVVVSDEDKNGTVTSFSLKNVNVAQVFDALFHMAKGLSCPDSAGHTHTYFSGFQTHGAPDENSVWYFNSGNQDGDPYTCHCFPLKPYLDAGYKLDDITTLVETTYKMIWPDSKPETHIKYHKDTKMLIVDDTEQDLKKVDNAMAALATTLPTGSASR